MNTAKPLHSAVLAPPAATVRAGPAVANAWTYSLAVPQGAQRALARGWLGLGLFALVGAGLFSVLLVLSRTPGLNQWFDVAHFFRVALVVHVDLSVLVWFVALGGLLWSVNGSAQGMAWGWAALLLCTLGAALMSLAPFMVGFGLRAEPVMANYIPVLDGPLFIAGLWVFGAGAALLVLRSLLTAPKPGGDFGGDGALRFGLNAAAVSAAVALAAFAASFALVPTTLARTLYEYMEASSAMFRAPTSRLVTTSGEPMQLPYLSAHAIGTQVSGQGTALAGTDPTFARLALDAFKYGQLVKVSAETIDDAAFEIAGVLGRDIGRSLGRLIGTDLVSGTGSGKPRGLMIAAAAGGGSVTTGGSLIGPTYDSLVSLVYGLTDAYRGTSAG